MSELLPNLSTVADDLCLVHSFNTNAINHDPGKTSFCTGSEIPGKPSMGSWLSYGLGTLNKDLPDFVVMPSDFYPQNIRARHFRPQVIQYCFYLIPKELIQRLDEECWTRLEC